MNELEVFPLLKVLVYVVCIGSGRVLLSTLLSSCSELAWKHGDMSIAFALS